MAGNTGSWMLQGSVLIPVLFSLYDNEITDVFVNSSFPFHADDLQIYLHSSISELNASVAFRTATISVISY